MLMDPSESWDRKSTNRAKTEESSMQSECYSLEIREKKEAKPKKRKN